jgi:hypothetical protein
MCTSQVGAEYARAWEGVVSVVVGWWWGCWVKMLRNHSGGQAQRCMRALLPCCRVSLLFLFDLVPSGCRACLLPPRPAGRQCYAQEPIFVPRPGGVAEDDGWVLALVFDGALERSQLVILDAQRLSGGREKREWMVKRATAE